MVKALLSRPEALLAGTFSALILTGTVLLRLPLSHARGPVRTVDALFTATSAVCVTGLITVDTAAAYSRAGQVIILILIQLGGLGIMTFAALAAEAFRFRLSFSSHAAWRSAFFEDQTRIDLRRALHRILLLTLVIEGLGAGLLFWGFRRAGIQGGWFEAVFHSISAFCNAGFSVYSQNAVAVRDSNLILFTLMALIVLGGLGYTVLIEVVGRAWRRLRRNAEGPVVWSLHSRVVLKVSGLLILGGALILVCTGLGNTEDHLGRRAIHALFQSVSARTAGFNTVDIAALPVPSLLILIALMFVGGSPGSCAGGIKTTTAAVWTARIRARLTGRQEVTLGRRRVAPEMVRRAALVLSVATLWNLAGIFLLTCTEGGRAGVRLEQLIFEQISAFGTVGLSANLTPTLSLGGKLWIILTMFVGRIGPLTLAYAIFPTPRSLYQYPTERIMIG